MPVGVRKIIILCLIHGCLTRMAGGVSIPTPDFRPWKQIDYGNPMLDDPTVQYVPPATGDIQFEPGKRSGTESLWPIKPRIPTFLYKTPGSAYYEARHDDRALPSFSYFAKNKNPAENVKVSIDSRLKGSSPSKSESRRNRQGFSVTNFAIQQGHSKVKKYGK